MVFMGKHFPQFLEDVPLDVRTRMWFQRDGSPLDFLADLLDVLDCDNNGPWIGKRGLVQMQYSGQQDRRTNIFKFLFMGLIENPSL